MTGGVLVFSVTETSAKLIGMQPYVKTM